MSGFSSHTGSIAVYNVDNVDTDRIIPARFLSMVTKSGYGDLVFKDLRGPDFVLDLPEAKGVSVLVTGTNFGCGSSREHAVWAIQQAGFKVVISKKTGDSPGYSDIFRSNSANCGLCLIELPEESHRCLVDAGTGAEATIDLGEMQVTVQGRALPIQMNEATRQQLMAGLDLIGTTLRLGPEIDSFESKWDSFSSQSRTIPAI